MGVWKRGKNYYIDYYAGPKRFKEMVGPNQKAAKAAHGKRLSEIREGKFFDRKNIPKITMDELIKRYREWAKVKKSYHRSDAVHLVPVQEFFKGRLLSEITEYDVETFRSVRKDTSTWFGTPRSASTCNQELAMVKALFNKATAWGLAEKNPAARVKPLPKPMGRTRFLTVEEAGRLLEAASRHLRPILVCALETGMRRGEIMNLKWSDVDMKNGMLFIGETKNGESRHVPMSNRLRSTLAALPRRIGSDHVFTGEAKIGKGKQIGVPGKPFHDVRTAFENACTKAGITGFRFHDLRHTAASHLIMAGVPFKTVGEILGHKTEAMIERYSHLTPEHKRKAVEMLPDWEKGAAIGPQSVPR